MTNERIPGRCDVVVIGGGPAGSAVAAALAGDGYEVALLEKSRHPRPMVGESLLPHFWKYTDLLGVSEAIERDGFVAKAGGTVCWGGRIRQMSFRDFGYQRSGLHVERDRFDDILLRHAATQGASVFEQANVTAVELDEASGPCVRYTSLEHGDGAIRCRMVADASGQNALIARQTGLREIDRDFRFVALWGYYRGARYVAQDGRAHAATELRDVPPTTFITSVGDWGWSWHIAQREQTSVGLVLPIEHYKADKQPGESMQAYFRRTSETLPQLGRLLDGAHFVDGSVNAIRDYSYMPTRLAGPGYFLLGDAAAFVDPIFSLGVVIALYSGHLAAWAIGRTLARASSAEASRQIYDGQLRGRLDVARSLALPVRDGRLRSNALASRTIEFQSREEQELMYLAAAFTTRSVNFAELATGGSAAASNSIRYRELAAIDF